MTEIKINNLLWKRYKLFYISQSTAFITPILYTFLQEKLNLSIASILQIASSYWLLSIFLQLPCGIFADRWGVKSNLYLCLILQVISCLSLLFIGNVAAYHLYLICINIAQSLCTGASTILIKKQFQDSDEKKFKEFTFNLQNSFYKITSVFIVISSVLYTVNVFVPFVLQIINFAVSLYYLRMIPEQSLSKTNNQKNIFLCAKDDIKKSLLFMSKDKYYLYLVICCMLFGLGVNLNHKLIQSQLNSLFSHDKVVLTGCVIALGNLFSSSGAKFFYEYISKRFSSSIEILVLGSVLIFSYMLMSISYIWCVILGFMTINIFKGCYRPLISTELVTHYPFKNSMSTNSSIIYSITVIFSSLIQYFLAYSYKIIEIGNLTFASFSALILFCSYLFSRSSSEWKIKSQINALTGKLGIIEKKTITFHIFSSIHPQPVRPIFSYYLMPLVLEGIQPRL